MLIYLVFFYKFKYIFSYENIPSLLLILAIFFVFVLVFTHTYLSFYYFDLWFFILVPTKYVHIEVSLYKNHFSPYSVELK